MRAVAEERCHHQAECDDGADQRQGDQRQADAVIEHDADEDAQERQVEHHSVTAAPATNSRMVSTPCRRAAMTPVGRCSKLARRQLEQMIEDGGAEHRVDTGCRYAARDTGAPQLSNAENTMNTDRPMPMTIRVLSVRCTTTLSMIVCEKRGVPSASSWMIREGDQHVGATRVCASEVPE